MAFPSTLAAGRDDLVVITQYYVVMLRNGLSGLTVVGTVPVPATATGGFQGAFFTNLDGNITPDTVGAGGTGAGAVLFDGTNATRLDYRFMGSSTLMLGDNNVNWNQVGDSGFGAKPDLFALDRNDNTPGPATLHLYRDLTVTSGPAAITPQSHSSRVYSGPQPVDPDSFVVGNFDGVGAPEIVGFEDTNGLAACVRDSGSALEACTTGP